MVLYDNSNSNSNFNDNIDNILEQLDSYVQNENNIRIYEENGLIPHLSINQIEYAYPYINNFFTNNLQYISYGNTSGGTCSHILFRRSNKVYIIYMYITGRIVAYNCTTFHLNNILGDRYIIPYNNMDNFTE